MSVTIYTGTGSDSSLNLSNTNFRRLMDLVGIELSESLCGEFAGAALEDLRQRTLFALESVRAMPALDGGTPSVEFVGARGARCVEMGLREGYFESRLSALLAEIEVALETGQPLRYA